MNAPYGSPSAFFRPIFRMVSRSLQMLTRAARATNAVFTDNAVAFPRLIAPCSLLSALCGLHDPVKPQFSPFISRSAENQVPSGGATIVLPAVMPCSRAVTSPNIFAVEPIWNPLDSPYARSTAQLTWVFL